MPTLKRFDKEWGKERQQLLKALSATKDMGIFEKRIKLVLRNFLQLYDGYGTYIKRKQELKFIEFLLMLPLSINSCVVMKTRGMECKCLINLLNHHW